jgi:2,3-dihydroxybenzoate decarboxylase
MVSGLFDTYPTLKIILGHCGEGLPFVLRRIDQRMRHFVPYWPAKKTMGEYWEENFWVTTSGVQDDGTLMDTLRSVGEDRVMFSADYPYEDDLEMAAWFDRVELNGRTKRKIGFENARALLKLGGQVQGK